MALSSKKIIECIASFKAQPFTLNRIITECTDSLKKKKKQPGKKSKKSSLQKDIENIHYTVHILYSIGYLTKKKKNYKRSTDFPNVGKISISPKGKGEVDLGFMTVMVKSDFVNNAHHNDIVAIEITDYRKGTFFGKVTSILERNKEQYYAFVDRKTKGLIYYRLLDMQGEMYACSNRFKNDPDLQTCVFITLTGKQLAGKPECKVEATCDLQRDSFDVDRIIIKNNLPGPHKEYPELEHIQESMPKKEQTRRDDFTDLLTVTIDGETAKDFDDAITFISHDKGYQLYVHIADVSAYVQPGSALDREAYKRGTSYYLGNRVIPMLPEMISNNLCSLKQHVERLTLTVILDYDKKYNVRNYSFHRGRIMVDKRLTYKGADELIRQTDDSPIPCMLRELETFTQALKKKRIEQGRVDLQISDPELLYKGDKFEDIIFAYRLKSHMIIEECMLSANEIVSKALRENNIPALYRVHEDMSKEKIFSLQKFLRSIGIRLKTSKNLGITLQKIVDQVAGKEFEAVVNFIILRSMMQAYYYEEPLGHFGLGFHDYTHFTSPIRRYPDLIVHRCIKSLIDKDKAPYPLRELSSIGEQCSKLERIAQKAERDLFKLKACRLMSQYLDTTFTGIISGVSKFGIYVTLNEKPVEGMIPLRLLTDDYYLVIEDEFTVTGRRYGKRYTLGDEITVKVIKSDIVSMQIDFDIVID